MSRLRALPTPARGPLAVALLLVAVLVAALLAPSGRPAVGPSASPAAGACAALVAVVADGSAERPGPAGAGPTPAVLLRALTRALAQRSATLEVRRVAGRTRPARVLVGGRVRPGRADRQVTAARVRRWREGTDRTTSAAAAAARAAADDPGCPERRVLLVGHAQGAGAAHRALLRLTAAGAGEQVVGAVLVADPERRRGTRALRRGAPAAPATARGAATTRLGPAADLPSAPPAPVAWSVCATGDLVCDLTARSPRVALAAHRSYRAGAGAAALRAVAAEVVALLPEPPAGPGADPSPSPPPSPSPSPSPWPAGAGTLAAGGQAGCVVDADGAAWCWGRGGWGQLGDGQSRESDRPVLVRAPDDGGGWATVSTSGGSTCGTRTTGTLWCWGRGDDGQLGLGDGTDRPSPVRVGTADGWASVSAGWFHSCGVRSTGALRCWGLGNRGQLGTGATTTRRTPVGVGTATWRAVAVGGHHTCGVRADQTLWCWGLDATGQLGVPGDADRLEPAQVGADRAWSDVSAGWGHTCAVAVDGSAWCWGLGERGRLGDGTTVRRDAPTRVLDPAGGAVRWVQVAVGDGHTCGLTTAGAVHCWGSARWGQVGDGARGVRLRPAAVPGGPWSALAVGWGHTCGLRATGVACWGDGEGGQLGDGARPDRTAPGGPAGTAATGSAPPPATAGPVEPAGQVELTVTTFNVLGSQHTAPGGSARHYAPGRVRTEWAADLVLSTGSAVVGLQEVQADQLATLRRVLGPTWAVWPGHALGGRGVPQTLIWRDDLLEATWTGSITVPFVDQQRPQPVVVLRHRASGRELAVLNVHNSPKDAQGREDERDRAEEIEVAEVRRLRAEGLPVVLVGDLNEKAEVFCRFTAETDLRAAQGGANDAAGCRPPAVLRVDWVFGSVDLTPGGFSLDASPRVRRVTDHAVLSSRVRLPAPPAEPEPAPDAPAQDVP